MASVGVGGGRFAARVAATITRPGLVKAVLSGEETAFLAPLSIDHLPASDSMRWRRRLLGLEDEFGLTNVVVKPGLHERQRPLVRGEPFVIVRGELQRRDGTVNVVAKSLAALSAGPVAPAGHNFG